ncbi:MAG: hypothetical protein Q8L55_08450 [Phycisphaerales bacterium]|nr:hypothetical protein [Phycisphaerales bacterium]
MTDAEAVNAGVWNNARRGVLEVHERLERVGFVIGHGVILLPAPGFMKDGRTEDGVLHVPDERDDGLGVQLEVRVLDEGGDGAVSGDEGAAQYGGLLDRWEAYHGRRGTSRFAVAVAQGARLGGAVVDGEEIELVNTLANEGTLLRTLNGDRAKLARAVSARLGVEVFEPTAVGIDQRGIDVRTRTSVMRVRAAERLGGPSALAFVEELLREGEGRHG